MQGWQHPGFASPNSRMTSMPPARALSLLTLALCAATAQAGDGPGCQEHKLFGDERRFECAVESAPGGTPPRFVALFSGGHDDTMASLKVQADGADSACGAGSKPELMGEDGNVSLLCHLPVGGLSPGSHVITVHLRWSHAQYEGFKLER
jgi:hypothetical protein